MSRVKLLWRKYGGWILMSLPVAAIIMCLAVSAAKPQPRTIAEPPAETEITFDMEKNHAYTADVGVVIIPVSDADNAVEPELAPAIADTPADALLAVAAYYGNYTLPEDAMLEDGSIGLLSIPKLNLTVSVYETDDELEAMTHGVAHFKTTSAWSGNIGLCGHNQNFDLTDGFFKNIHMMKPGDSVSYKTALGSRRYIVETVAEIAETDWSYLGRTEDDRLTMITCISGKPRSRLVVQAVAK